MSDLQNVPDNAPFNVFLCLHICPTYYLTHTKFGTRDSQVMFFVIDGFH